MRQVLDQELRKTLAARELAARQARFQAGRPLGAGADHDRDKENRAVGVQQKKDRQAAAAASLLTTAAGDVKRDFFGRRITPAMPLQATDGNAAGRRGAGASHTAAASAAGSRARGGQASAAAGAAPRVWVTYHEGLNNAVRKPISVDEFLRGL